MANPSDQRGCGDAPRPAVRRRPAGCERSPRNRREESGRVRRRRSAHCARPRGGAPTNESHTMTPLIAKQHQARIGILPSRRTNDPEQNPEGTADGAGAPAVDPPKFRKGQHNSSSGRRSIGAPEPGDPPAAAGCPRKRPARRPSGPRAGRAGKTCVPAVYGLRYGLRLHGMQCDRRACHALHPALLNLGGKIAKQSLHGKSI